jgi:hypothetical protein
MSVTKSIVFTLFLVFSADLSFAWGPEGHRIVAAVAQDHLTETAKRNIQALLGDKSLASVATWADDIRAERPETANWHVVDIPKSAGTFLESRDCFHPLDPSPGSKTDHQNCVVDRIDLFKQVLRDRSAARQERTEALMYVIHFVAEVHEPYHALGDGDSATQIHVIEFGNAKCGLSPCSLHQTWDAGMITQTGLSEANYVKRLDKLIADQHLSASGTAADWANESHHYAQLAWLDSGGSVDETYYERWVNVMDQRLALAGVRLAAILDEAFGSR